MSNIRGRMVGPGQALVPILRMRRLTWIGVLLAFGCAATPKGPTAEQRDWQTARDERTAESFERFVARYPKSFYAAEARERAAYERALDENSVEALERFLRDYPDGKFTDVSNIEWYLENEMFRLSISDTAAAKAYLKRFPSGRHSTWIRDRLPGQLFEQAKQARTPEAFADFVDRYPEHELAEKARRLQQELESERRGLAALAAARTISLSVDYWSPSLGDDREREPPWLDEEFVEPASTFFRLADLRKVNEGIADIEVHARIRVYWIPEDYRGKFRVRVHNAGLQLDTELEVRVGEDAIVRRKANARKEPLASMLFAEVDGQPPASEQVIADEPRFRVSWRVPVRSSGSQRSSRWHAALTC